MLDSTATPRAIVAALDEYVIGQDDAKRIVAVAVYAHFRKLERARSTGTPITKSNVLLIGPSGTGKTLLCETLAKALDVPFATAEATSIAQARFVNDEIDAILERLIDRAGGDLERASRGIVFIDEIDKLKAPAGQPRSVSGESVQHALLKIMEGCQVKLGARYLDTTNVLFICGGAFVGLDEIRSASHNYGFIATMTNGQSQKILDRLNARVKPTDLFTFGLIPEFTGRLPVIARFSELSRDMLVRIMTEPRDSIYAQMRAIFANEGVELVVARRTFEQLADLALEYKTGARSLRGLFEELITPVLYEVPDDRTIERVEIDSLFSEPRLVHRTPARRAAR